MFSSISKFFTELFLGKLVHKYDISEVKHGAFTYRNRFDIRQKKSISKLFHERVTNDGHNINKSYHEYDERNIELLIHVFTEAIQCIDQSQAKEFGLVFEEKDGSMLSREYYYTEQSGGEFYLFCRIEAKSHTSTSSRITYYPFEEIELIAELLIDAQKRMQSLQ